MRWTPPAVILALALLAPSLANAQVGPQARVEGGLLQGRAQDGVESFKGVPYAAPPVGDLRWRAPQPAAPWTGARDATRFGALCMQDIVVDNGVGPGPASEDCLTLNVYAPAAPHAKLPVMVWIHGGGLVNGSGTAALYDGSPLARRGVVVVTVNYRLGRFGFFAHPALTAEAAGAPTANYGLMDQIAALRWVRRNAGAFGGDPADVTIFGESAGGASVNRLMIAPQARGLFARAIAESGLGAEHGKTLAQAEAAGRAFAGRVGVPGDGAAAAAALRALPASAVLDTPPALSEGEGDAPILDGVMLREDPLAAFRAGREAGVPYMVGSNSLEIPPAWAAGFWKDLTLSPARQAEVAAAYGSQEAYRLHVLGDAFFAAPARALAAAHAANGWPAWLYRFSVVSPSVRDKNIGAIHASERQYVFDTLTASVWPTDANDEAQARTMGAYWTAFARTGDPNGAGRPAWPRYGASDELLDFTNDGPMAEKTPNARVLDVLTPR